MHPRADHTIGTKALPRDEDTIPDTADGGWAALSATGKFWREALVGADDATLDRIGRGAFPWGLDPTSPFLDTSRWVDHEPPHHGGGIAPLRDLHRAMPR